MVRRPLVVEAGTDRGGSPAGRCAMRGERGFPVAGDGVTVDRRRLTVSALDSVLTAREFGRAVPIARGVSEANRRGDGSLPASDGRIVGRFIRTHHGSTGAGRERAGVPGCALCDVPTAMEPEPIQALALETRPSRHG